MRLLLASLLLIPVVQVSAYAQTIASKSAEDDLLVDALVTQLFATRAANDAQFSVQLRTTLDQLEEVTRERAREARRRARVEAALAVEKRRATVVEAQLAEREAALLAMDQAYQQAVAEKTALIDEIGRRDRDWAAQVAAYREELTGLVSQASPDKLALLWQFASGEPAKSYAILAELTEAENRARLDAADQIAGELQEAARIKADNDDRLLGILALGPLGQRQIAIAEVRKPWARIVERGKGEKADYLVLVMLASLDADDVAAAALKKEAEMRDARAEVRRDFPILDFLEALATQRQTNWRHFAELVRNPKQATTLSDAAAALQPLYALEVSAAERAPLFDALGDCEESVTARSNWDIADEALAISRDSGVPLLQPISEIAAAERPEPMCEAAAKALAQLLSVARHSPELDILVGNAALLTYRLLTIRANAQAAEMAQGAEGYCNTIATRSDFLQTNCALLRIANGGRLATASPSRARAEIDVGVAMLDGVDLRNLPGADAAALVPVSYQLAAFIFENTGDLANAITAARKAERASRSINTLWVPYATTELRPIALLIELGTLEAKAGRVTRAGATFDEASSRLDTFLRAHPNSFLACDLNDTLVEAQLSWLVGIDRQRALDLALSVTPALNRCERVDAGVGLELPAALQGVTSRRMFLMRIYTEIAESQDDAISVKAWEKLAEETTGALEPDASPVLVLTHRNATFFSGHLAAERNDSNAALRWFEDLAAVSRVHHARSSLQTALQHIARARMRRGEDDLAGLAGAELTRLCATAIVNRPHKEAVSYMAIAEELELRTVDLKCFLIADSSEVARPIFERDIETYGSLPGADAVARDVGKLADAWFYYGLTLKARYRIEEAVTAYDRSLSLRLAAATDPSDTSDADLLPYVMAHRARLPGGAGWQDRLRDLLLARRTTRPLSRDESDLLTLASQGGLAP